jgi:hypothetical protein
MAERETDDVGTTGARSGVDVNRETDGKSRSGGQSDVAEGGGAAVADNETADSKGTIISGGGNSGLTQSSGGSVD